MRYAVLADIHSNLDALNAVMEQLPREHIDRYLCLGDLVGYGAEPAACMTRMQDCQALTVGGNHDLACIGKFDPNKLDDAARAAVLWTRDQLSFTDLDILRRLPLVENDELFTLAHGTLRHPERFEYLFDMAQAIETMSVCQTLFCLVGHTHVPYFVEYDRRHRRLSRIMTEANGLSDISYEDDAQAYRYLINPGSVGQPRDGNPQASLALIDTECKRITIKRIAYDITSAQRKIQQAGLPGFLAERLAIGR